MIRKLITIIAFTLCLPFQAAFCQQTSGGGGSDELKNTCDVSGGTYTTSSSGWACCWSDWGCYGCTDGNCKMKCHTRKCRKANRQGVRAGSGSHAVEGLAPQGKNAPIAPLPKTDKVKQKPD